MAARKKLPALRMARKLAERAKELGGFARLAREITELYVGTARARREPGKTIVDRRKLKNIADGRDVHFSTEELRALDKYLEQYGEGLSNRPLFEKPKLLPALAESGDVAFLLSSKLDEELKRVEFSHWDVTGAMLLLNQLNRFDVRFDIQEVRRGTNEAEARLAVEQEWARLLDKDGPSIVCMGSPRANHASEIVLAKMFKIREFARDDGDVQPPFRFVWTKRMPFPSSFAEPEANLPSGHAAEMTGSAYAIYLDDEFRSAPMPSRKRSAKTYGVVVAQRRPNGQVWLVVAGLTGAATYAAAELVPAIDVGLDPVQPGTVPKISWTPIEARIEEDEVSKIYKVNRKRALESRWA